MHFLKAHFWKLTFLGGAVAVASWLGWGYATQGRKTLVAIDTTTGKLQWVHPLADDFGFSKGPIAGNGKVVLDGCLKTADKNCGAYQIETFDAQSGRLLWSESTSRDDDPYQTASNQAVAIQHDRLYSQLENDLHALDLKTGVQLWQTPRQWFYRPSIWYGMGIVAQPNKLAILNIDRRTRLLQIFDPKIGKLQQGAAIKIPKLETTKNIIAANDRTLFLETAGLVPGDTPNSFYDSGTSTITAYDSKTLQPRFRTGIKSGGIFQMDASETTLLLGTYETYDVSAQKSGGNAWLAMDAVTGQVLWQKKDTQLDCQLQRADYRVDIDTVYLPCRRYGERMYEAKDTRTVALSIQTGAIK
jgi:outer membrane protein assembly factor BamB